MEAQLHETATSSSVPETITSFHKFKPSWGPIGEQVFKRSYARDLEELGRKETWPESVVRVVDGNLSLVSPEHIEHGEREKLIDLLMPFASLPAGRHLSASGVKGRQFIFNCHTSGFDSEEPWAHFTFLFDELMQGGGVGSNYSDRYLLTLPLFARNVEVYVTCNEDHPDKHLFSKYLSLPETITAPQDDLQGDYNLCYFVVPDSREGWVETTEHIFKAAWGATQYERIVIDVSKLRKKGSKLKTGGGVSPGPEPLVIMLFKLAAIMRQVQKKPLTWRMAMDIDHLIAACVVAGGKRRSSRMSAKSWKDPGIFEFIDYKKIDGENWTTNISVEIDDDFIHDFEQDEPRAHHVLEGIVQGKRTNGEPGIWNRSLSQQGEREPEKIFCTNPCQPAWATMLTPAGIRTMGEVQVGDTVWSGKRWTKVAKKIATGVKPVFAYRTRAGVFVGTGDHRVVSNGTKIMAEYAESIDAVPGPLAASRGGSFNPQDVMDGLVFGDGMVHQASNNLVVLLVGAKDQSWLTSEVRDLFGKARPGITEEAHEVATTIFPEEIPRTFNRTVPARFLHGNVGKVASFLRGLYSANGSVVDARVTLKASGPYVIDAVQSMLSGLGISSYYTINKPHTVEFENGSYVCKQSYDLNITTDRRKFHDLIGFIQPDKNERLIAACERKTTGQKKTTYDITETYFIQEEPVFDITVEDEEHTYWTGGLLVSNCGELPLHMWENCFAGDEKLVTKEYGAVRFVDIVGQDVTVPTKQGWRPATISCFGTQNVQRVTFAPVRRNTGEKGYQKTRSNYRVDVVVTPNHRWEKVDGEITASLSIEDVIHMNAASFEKNETYKKGIQHGIIFGDGSADRQYADGEWRHRARLFGDKAKELAQYFDHLTYPESCNGAPEVWLKSEKNLKEFPTGSEGSDYLAGFVAGWGMTDGSARANGTITLSSTHPQAEAWLRQNAAAAGWVLRSTKDSGTAETNYGKRINPLKFFALCQPGNEYLAWQVISIESLPEKILVYCATVPGTERFTLASGISTMNCCLGHINLQYWAGKPLHQAIEAFRLMTRWLIRATYGDIPQPRQRAVTDKNRRIGVGFFGFHGWLVLNGIKYSECWKNDYVQLALSKFRAAVDTEAQKYADELGIPHPVKTTTVAPTGSVALLPGVTSGLQPLFAPWFKRRVRFSDTDSGYQEAVTRGLKVYDDPDAPNTKIVEYWCEDPLVARVRARGLDPTELVEGQDEIAFTDYLEVQAMVQDIYANNAISFTINIPETKMPNESEMVTALGKVLYRLKGTTVFPDKSRENAPFERLTRQQFEEYNGPKEVSQVEEECKSGCPIS